MKRVVIIGSDFTPSSYPPALRVRFFAQHLAEFGWEPTILTIDPKEYEWEVDKENEHLLPKDLRVIRTPVVPISTTRKLGLGDIGLRSLWHHWRALSKLCRTEQVDLVLIPVPPYYPAIIGRLAHLYYKVPYVVDFIDPWVTLNYWNLPGSQRPVKRTISYGLSRLLEPFALKCVGHIVGVSKATTDGVVDRYSWLSEADATEIPYGAAANDFDYLRAQPRRQSFFTNDDKNFHMSYVGRGGEDMKVALRGLFKAIKKGLNERSEVFQRLRLHFIGTTYAPKADGKYQVMPVAREFGLEDYVSEHPGRVAYLDALQILVDSDALIVPGSDRPHYTASKIFPYILAKKPLLALFHENSSVVRIVTETKAGAVITFNGETGLDAKVDDILNALEQIIVRGSNYETETDWSVVDNYSTRAMTERLAQAFDKAISNNQRYPGAMMRSTPHGEVSRHSES